MIKIIKPGTLRKVTCNNCGAVLRYDTTEDMKTENVESFLGAGVKDNSNILFVHSVNIKLF